MMWKFGHDRVRACMVVGLLAVTMAAVAGCGVKSSPKYPEGADFPHDYPYRGKPKAVAEPEAPSPADGQAVMGLQNMGGYQPPAPATETFRRP